MHLLKLKDKLKKLTKDAPMEEWSDEAKKTYAELLRESRGVAGGLILNLLSEEPASGLSKRMKKKMYRLIVTEEERLLLLTVLNRFCAENIPKYSEEIGYPISGNDYYLNHYEFKKQFAELMEENKNGSDD